MAAPGTIGNLVAPGEDNTNRKIADLERVVKELAPSVMETILPLITDLQDQQAVLEAQQALLAAQQAEILALVNTQLLPDFGFDDASGYAIPAGIGSRVVRATYTHTVPAGYTKALIVASAQDAAVNSTAGFDYINSFVQIASGTYAFASGATVPAGYTGASFASITNLLTGLSGGATITVTSEPHSTYGAFAAHAVNSTILSGTCLFLR